MLVFGIVVGVFIALNALILIVFHAIYRKMFAHRADRTVPGVRDRAVEEFEGLKAEPFSFVSDGVMLRGFRYTGAKDNGRRIVFAHGIGAGHEAYLTEIAYFCGRGYEVCAFDFPGCVRSDGNKIGGMHVSVPHFLNGLNYIRETFGEKPLYLVGHSWGGYTVTAAAKASGARAVVEISGFVRPAKVYAALLGKWMYPWIKIYLFLRFGKKGDLAAKESDVPVLALHGTADKIVPLSVSIAKAGFANVKACFCEGKRHNPYSTKEADAYLCKLFASAPKKGANREEAERFFGSIDYIKATEEDPAVMEKIVSFLERA